MQTDASLGDEGIRQAVEQLVTAPESAGDSSRCRAAVRVLAAHDQAWAGARASGAFPVPSEFVGTERFTVCGA